MSTEAPEAFPGKPPKTSAWIRSVLKHVHGANAGSASDLSPGTASDDPMAFVPAAEFRRRGAAKRFVSLLDHWDIPRRLVRRGGRTFVYVPSVHLDEALAIFAHTRREAPQRISHAAVAPLPSPELSMFQVATHPLARIVFPFLGAAIAQQAFSRTSAMTGSSDWELTIALVGAAVGLFTWIGLAFMMGSIAHRVRMVRHAANIEPTAEEAPEPDSRSPWSTLLTISRNRRNTRSRAASAPSSATSRS